MTECQQQSLVHTLNTKVLVLEERVVYSNKDLLHGGWRDGSEAVQSSICSGRRPRFGSQNPHGSSQRYVTSAPGAPMPSSSFQEHQALIWCTYIHTKDKHLLKIFLLS